MSGLGYTYEKSARKHSLSDKQGESTWQQLESVRRDQTRRPPQSDPEPEHQGHQPLKRKERATAEDWFEERIRQKSKIPPAVSYKFGQSNTSRDPRSPSTGDTGNFGENITSTTPTNSYFEQSYIHPQRAINLANPDTPDQSNTGSPTSGRMSHRPDGDPYYRGRNYGDDGGRSPPRHTRGSYGSARRGSRPYRRPDNRRESFDRPPYKQRSPADRRDDDYERSRETREYRNEWGSSIAQSGSKGQGPIPGSPGQTRAPLYPPTPLSTLQSLSSETTDPRLRRKDSIQSIPGVYPGVYSGAVDLTYNNNNEGGVANIRSGSRTPLEPDASILRPKVEIQSVLLDFSTTVTELASFNIQLEMAKKELDKQMLAFEHSRKHHAKFPTLKEQQENNVVRARKDYQALEDKCKELEARRDRAINAIGAAVGSGTAGAGAGAAGGAGTGGSGGTDSERTRRLEKEVIKIQDQLAQVQELQERHITIFNRETLLDLKNNQHQLAVNARSRQHQLDGRFEKIQSRIDDFPNLRLDVDKLREETRKILDMLERHAKDLREVKDLNLKELKDLNLKELKTVVEGSPDGEQGLLHFLAQAEDTIEKLKVNMNAMDDDMEKMNKDIRTLKDRRGSHEPKSRADSPVAKLSYSAKSAAQLSSDSSTLSKIHRDISDFRSRLDVAVANFEQVLRDQKDRDEIVMQEMESLSKNFQGHRVKVEADLRSVQTMHNEAVERVDSSISQLSNTISDLGSKVNLAPTRVPDTSPAISHNQQVVGIGRIEYENNLHTHQAALEQALKSIESVKQEVGALRHAFHHLDTRYNNISTDQMARHMVGQLQQLYPQVSNVQQEFDRIKAVQSSLQERVLDVSEKIEQLRGQNSGSEAFQSILHQLQHDVSALKEARDRDALEIDATNTRLKEAVTAIGTAVGKNNALIATINHHLEIPHPD